MQNNNKKRGLFRSGLDRQKETQIAVNNPLLGKYLQPRGEKQMKYYAQEVKDTVKEYLKTHSVSDTSRKFNIAYNTVRYWFTPNYKDYIAEIQQKYVAKNRIDHNKKCGCMGKYNINRN